MRIPLLLALVLVGGCATTHVVSDASGGADSAGSASIVEAGCHDAHSDPIEVTSAVLADDELVLQVGHGGGCAEHTYRLCPDPVLLDSDPAVQRLVVVHDGHGDTCEAYLMPELRVPVGALPHRPLAVESIDGRTIAVSIEP